MWKTELGEDEKSFARYNKALLTEYLKSKPNMQLAEELMTVSYSMHRSDILRNPCHMSALLEKYPFLKNERQELFPKVLQQAVLESQQSLRLRRALKDIPNNSTNELLSLLLMPVLLPDSKCKSDSNKVLYFTKGTLDIERIVQENKQPQPYILCTGDFDDCGQCFLVADCQVVMPLNCNLALALLASYFAYNVTDTVVYYGEVFTDLARLIDPVAELPVNSSRKTRTWAKATEAAFTRIEAEDLRDYIK
uniref:Uncharacterized protein n=1 Tax=Amphimedon queenslandica TaxID=400682 RepID=A0A1X7UX00_AMPQE